MSTTRYKSLGSTSDPKQRSGNASTFSRYLSDMKEKIASSWRITPEVVMQYQGIAKFKAMRHNMWIQEHKDPDGEWLQLRYCINIEEVDWEIKDWVDDWKIPVITKDMPKGKEIEAGSSKTSAGGSAAMKKPPQQKKLGPKPTQQKKESAPKKNGQT
jgi:hypothetical protein